MAEDPELEAQVERLRLLVEDLRAASAAQQADGASGDRWQARLSSLETRLSMVESTFRSETERVQGAVRSVEALAAGLRDALGGAEAIAETGRALQGHVDRERTVAAALDGLADQLNRFTATLAGELRRAGEETASATRAQLDAAVRAVTDAAATLAGTAEVAPRVDLAIAAVNDVRQELAATANRLDPGSRLDALAEATARIDARLAQSATTVAQQVREALAEHHATADVTPALDAMRADLRQAVRALTTGQPAALDRLPGAVDAIARELAGLSARLDEVRARNEVTARDVSALADVPAALGRIADDVAALATLPAAVDGLGGAVEGAVAVHRRSAAAVETLQQSIDAARADVGAAASATQHLEQRLDAATEAAAAANRAALDAALAQQREAEAAAGAELRQRLDALAQSLDVLAARPTPETGVAAAVHALATELAERYEADRAAGDELAERLTARSEADAATVADLTARLEAIGTTLAELAGTAGTTAEAVTALAEQAAARAAAGDDPDAVLTRRQLDEALAVLAAELTEGPALPTVDDLRAAVLTLQGDLAQVARHAEALVNRPVPVPPPAVAPADLEAAVARLEQRLAEIPPPISGTELDAAVAALRLAVTSLPAPPAVDEVAAAVRATLPEQPATAADVQRAASSLVTALDHRLSGNVLEDLRAEIDRIVEFRSQIFRAISDLREHGPQGAASGDEVQAAAEGVAGTVRDAVAELRVELELVRRSVDGLLAQRELELVAADIDGQLDAIGRLVTHAVRSLHQIETSTVGVSSVSVRTRADINAALAALEAARRRRRAPVS